MSLSVMRQYGFAKTGRGIGVIADWICTICGKIIYEETNIWDIPENELKDGCKRCVQARDVAYNTARIWWDLYHDLPYYSREYESNGMYGLRDDLMHHLTRGPTPQALIRYIRRNNLELPPL